MYKLCDGILSSNVDGETILLDSHSGKYFGLNPTASRMLALALTGQDEAGIITALASEFDASEEKLRCDLSALLSDLVARGLVSDEA